MLAKETYFVSPRKKYTVVKKVGRGGFSDVYKASVDNESDNYALKVFKSNCDESRKNEINILLRLQSLYILKIVEAFQSKISKKWVMVTQLYDYDLYDYVDKFSVHKYVRPIIKQILKGCVALCAANIVHADLKPENILVRVVKDQAPKVVISDFGSSTAVGRKPHPYGHTYYFRSPELILGISLCSKVDVWAVGLITYELILGTGLFELSFLDSEEYEDVEINRIQLCMLEDVFGKFPRCLSTRRRLYFESNGRVIRSSGATHVSNFEIQFKKSVPPDCFRPDDIRSFLSNMLILDRQRRHSAKRMLDHAWILK